MKLTLIFVAILFSITGLTYFAKTNAQVVAAMPVTTGTDMDVVKRLDMPHKPVRYVLRNEDGDTMLLWAHYLGTYTIFIQMGGYIPDTVVFVKYSGHAVSVSPAVEEMIKKKLLK
jgi:hypothetical protein